MSAADPRSVDLRVEPFTGSSSEWDETIQGMAGSTFCHLMGWREVMADTLGHQAWSFAAQDTDGTTQGVLPLVRVRSRLFGDYLLSMPFLSYGGPIGTEAARLVLAEKAVAEARRLDVDLLELRARTLVPGDLETSSRKLTVILDLAESPELQWEKGIRAKLRSQIRRPMKEGMTARFGLDLVDPFYDVFASTMRDLGTPVLPKRFFQAIAVSFPGSAIFGVVEHQGRPVSAGCGFLWNGEYEITWAGALREASRLAPNMLLYWSLMEESIRRGARAFNFGRCSPDSGTHRFKQQWGGKDHPLPWAQWSPKGIVKTPSPEGAKYRLATNVWSRLPVWATNRLGPLLSRSLP